MTVDIFTLPDRLGATPCAETDPEIFFPDASQSTLNQARHICKTQCDVRTECLRIAMDAEQGLAAQWRYGIYGGLSPRQRANLDTAKPAQPKPVVASKSRKRTPMTPELERRVLDMRATGASYRSIERELNVSRTHAQTVVDNDRMRRAA